MLSCRGCREFASLATQVGRGAAALREPELPYGFDAHLAQRVLSEAARPQAERRLRWWQCVPALGSALRYAMVLGPVATLLVATGGGQPALHSGLPHWGALLPASPRAAAPAAGGLVGLLLLVVTLLTLEQGRWWLARLGLVAVPPSRDPGRAVLAGRFQGNAIYARYLSMWRRGGHALGPVPGLLLGCMTAAAPLVLFYRMPVLSLGLMWLWAVGQGVPRGYFTLGTELHAGTSELVSVTGLTPLEATRGYLLASIMPTIVELGAAAMLLACLSICGLVPGSFLVVAVMLALVLAVWASALGMSLALAVRQFPRGAGWLLLGVASPAVMGLTAARLYVHTPNAQVWTAYAAWTALAAVAAVMFLALSGVLLRSFVQQWGHGVEAPARAQRPDTAVARVPRPLRSHGGPFLVTALGLYHRAWRDQAWRQGLATLCVAAPVLALGPVRGMPVTMLAFLIWGFVQAFKVMDRDQHRATMSLLVVTPMSSSCMFTGQLVTAVLPLLLPWLVHCGVAIAMAPRMLGAVAAVALLSLLLGLTGAVLGLLNRYAIYLDFRRVASSP